MFSNFVKLAAYRELLLAWAARDIKVRYKQTALGIAWAIIQPLSLMFVFSFIFSYLIKIPTDSALPYPLFVYVALLPWTFLATSVNFSATSLVRNANLLKTVYFPREIFPLAEVAAGGVDFLCASAAFWALVAYYRLPPSPCWLHLPLILSIQVILTVGVSLLVAAANVFYRDVRFLVPLGMQL